MSGFFGIFNPKGTGIDLDAFEQMKTAADRPGHNGIKTYVDGHIALGHVMLRVSPESKYDQQPLKSDCGNYILVGHFRLDYRDDLGDKLGLTPQELLLSADSKLVLLAYQKWKEKCLYHLEGDWAFVLYNHKLKSLFFAKDPTGSSLLLYSIVKQKLVFGSFPKVIEAYFKNSLVINKKIFWLFANMKSADYKDDCLDKRVKKIKSGYCLRVESELQICNHKYFNISNQKVNQYRYTEDCANDFLYTLSEAIRSRINIQNQLGIFLSAGVDSSTIAALLAIHLKFRNKSLLAYTSYPAFINSIPVHKREFSDERQNVLKLSSMYSNMKTNFMNFMDVDVLMPNSLQKNFLYPVINKNSFWINGILERSSIDSVGRIFTGQLGNYTISWTAPNLHIWKIINLKFKKGISELKFVQLEYSLSKRTAFYLLFISPLLKKIKSHLKFYIYFLHNCFSNIFSREKSKLSFFDLVSVLLFSRHLYYLNPRLQRLKLLEKYLCSINGKWYLNTESFNIEYCDPSSDIRFLRFSLSLNEDYFFYGGVQKFIVKYIMHNYLPSEVLYNKKYFSQSNDIFHRLSVCYNEGRSPIQLIQESISLVNRKHSLNLTNFIVDKSLTMKITDQITDIRHFFQVISISDFFSSRKRINFEKNDNYD